MIITTTKRIGSLRAIDLFQFISDAIDSVQKDQYYRELTVAAKKVEYIENRVEGMLRSRYKVSGTQLTTIATNTGWKDCVSPMLTCYDKDAAHKDDPLDVE